MTDDPTAPCSACPLCRARSAAGRVSPRTRAAVVTAAVDLVTAVAAALAEIVVPGAEDAEGAEDEAAAANHDGPIPVHDDEADGTIARRRA
ncbi:hypothetical protein [Janibacter massiliensis]|uniref:hypothetical protein n=1 Tax=Janibacter massiliensis TaxID=2058291 RepID=UPI00131A5355|nr:hypothetical protein [Janibacter massiliensis]